MKKSNKKKIEEFIRVDHAGERGAIKIYEGQLLALNTFVKDDELKKTIEEMKEHEREHANYFEQEIRRRRIKPTKFLPFVGFTRCWFRIWLYFIRKKSCNALYSIC